MPSDQDRPWWEKHKETSIIAPEPLGFEALLYSSSLLPLWSAMQAQHGFCDAFGDKSVNHSAHDVLVHTWQVRLSVLGKQ